MFQFQAHQKRRSGQTISCLIVLVCALTGCGVPQVSAAASPQQENKAGNANTSTTGTVTAGPVIAPATAMVRLGDSQSFSVPPTTPVTASGSSTIGVGTWSVKGGSANGSIIGGTYTAPEALPVNEVITILYTVKYAVTSITSSATVTLGNPVPVIVAANLTATDSKQALVAIEGTGFLPSSTVRIGGQNAQANYIDRKHLTVAVSLDTLSQPSLGVQITNPAPASASSEVYYLRLGSTKISTDRSSISGGAFTLTFNKLTGFASGTSASLNTVALKSTSSTATSMTVQGYLPPWLTGTATFTLGVPDGTSESVLVPIDPVIVPYDAAQRLAMQTAFGPRPDVIARIQAIGMKPFLDEQMKQAPDVYQIPAVEHPQTRFLRLVGWGPAVLRQRTAWAFQTFIPESGFASAKSITTWETTLEAHAFGSFRQILIDAASVPIIGYQLNLTGNVATDDPNLHPNQNFGREFMQLFSLGTVLLNEDGSPKLDASGNKQAVYGEDTVSAMSRVFTGWDFAPAVDPDYSLGTYDYSQMLVATERFHDHREKVLFGSVVLPSGQSAVVDREQAIDAVFQHPNLPPFICRILIQRFVTSQPSPAYVKRIVNIFKDNGAGIRGDLRAVIQAILLDPEARSGDSGNSGSDGFLQDPLYTQLAVMHLLQINSFDDQPIYNPAAFGEPWWHSYSVFGYFSPSYIVPGTTINSPEFALFDDIKIVQRSQLIWGAVTQNAIGVPVQDSRSIYAQFPTLPAIIDALNHELYHGTMPQHVADQIVSTCSVIADRDLQLKTAVFLALSSDYYTVVN